MRRVCNTLSVGAGDEWGEFLVTDKLTIAQEEARHV